MKLLEDHAVLILIALGMVLIVVLTLALAGKPVDDRLISLGAVALIGGLLGRSNARGE